MIIILYKCIKNYKLFIKNYKLCIKYYSLFIENVLKIIVYE